MNEVTKIVKDFETKLNKEKAIMCHQMPSTYRVFEALVVLLKQLEVKIRE